MIGAPGAACTPARPCHPAGRQRIDTTTQAYSGRGRTVDGQRTRIGPYGAEPQATGW